MLAVGIKDEGECDHPRVIRVNQTLACTHEAVCFPDLPQLRLPRSAALHIGYLLRKKLAGSDLQPRRRLHCDAPIINNCCSAIAQAVT